MGDMADYYMEHYYYEDEFFQRDEVPEKETPQYTDKFRFNGKRKRTKFQKEIARDNKLMYGENW
jgi:hypothetical protein